MNATAKFGIDKYQHFMSTVPFSVPVMLAFSK